MVGCQRLSLTRRIHIPSQDLVYIRQRNCSSVLKSRICRPASLFCLYQPLWKTLPLPRALALRCPAKQIILKSYPDHGCFCCSCQQIMAWMKHTGWQPWIFPFLFIYYCYIVNSVLPTCLFRYSAIWHKFRSSEQLPACGIFALWK